MTVTCPYCGETESDRVPLGGKVAIIFPCRFSPVIEDNSDDAMTQKNLTRWKDEHGDYREWCEKGHLKAIGKTSTVLKIDSKDNVFKRKREDN